MDHGGRGKKSDKSARDTKIRYTTRIDRERLQIGCTTFTASLKKWSTAVRVRIYTEHRVVTNDELQKPNKRHSLRTYQQDKIPAKFYLYQVRTTPYNSREYNAFFKFNMDIERCLYYRPD